MLVVVVLVLISDGQLLAATLSGTDAHRRLCLLGLDDRQAHLTLLALGGGVDDDGGAGRELLAQHEVG